MNKIKSVIIMVILSVTFFSMSCYATQTAAPTDTGMSSDAESSPLTDEFIDEHKALINEILRNIFEKDGYTAEDIKAVLEDRIGIVTVVDDNTTDFANPQDELYAVLVEYKSQKDTNAPGIKLLASYFNENNFGENAELFPGAGEGTDALEAEKQKGIIKNIIIIILAIIIIILILAYLVFKYLTCFSDRKKPHYSDESENEDKYEDYYNYSYKVQYERLKEDYDKLKEKSDSGNDSTLKVVGRDNMDLYIENERLKKEVSELEASVRFMAEMVQNQNKTSLQSPVSFDSATSDSDSGTVAFPAARKEKKSLIIEGGQIQIIDGDYVEVQFKDNMVNVVPTNRALKASVRRSLSNFFDFRGSGDRSLNIESPCILEKDVQGYYTIVRKGIVQIS